MEQKCSERVSDAYSWHNHPCTKPVKVERDGKPYCTIHDPEHKKARIASKCYHRVSGAYCGKPAVETQYGYGLCAIHTNEYLDAQRRLQEAAPALLEALKDLANIVAEREQGNGELAWAKDELEAADKAIAIAEGRSE